MLLPLMIVRAGSNDERNLLAIRPSLVGNWDEVRSAGFAFSRKVVGERAQAVYAAPIEDFVSRWTRVLRPLAAADIIRAVVAPNQNVPSQAAADNSRRRSRAIARDHGRA